MNVKVTESGVLVPKDLLPGVDEVELRMDGNNVVVIPRQLETDPILGLGSNPVETGVTDASVAHDRYLYGTGG